MSYILLLLCLSFLLYKFDKAVCLFVAYYPLMSTVGLTNAIDLFQVVGIFALVIYFISSRYKKNNADAEVKYPFCLTLIFVTISNVVSNIMTVPHWPSSISSVIAEYALPIVFWNLMWKEENRKNFYKFFISFIAIVCIYCLFEFITQSNPIYDWYVNSSLFIGYAAERTEDIRFGSMRCHSIMRDVGALGTVCCIAICILFYLLKNISLTKRQMRNLWILVLLCCFCSLLTGTRTVILALALCIVLLSFTLSIKKKAHISILLLCTIIVFFDYFAQIFLSFTDTESVSGSSSGMREMQIAVVMNAIENSPLYGLGPEGTAIVMNRYAGAYGLESVWFQTLVNFGWLGAFALAFSLLQGFYYSLKNKNIVAFTVVTIFLLVKTMSSIPGLRNGYFIYIISFLIVYKINIGKHYENRNYNNA